LLNSARLRQSAASAPTETTSGKAAGQVGKWVPLLPAATTHATPLYECISFSQPSNESSGRSFLVGAVTDRWKRS